MAEKCVFCDCSPTSLEHVFSPKWIASLMPRSSSFTTRFKRIERETETLLRSWRKPVTPNSRVGSAEVKCVCSACNNGWMQDLDNELNEALTGLAKGQLGSVSQYGCEILATWATKISILIDGMWESVLDPATKRHFGEKREPPPGWRYWIGLRAETMEENHLRAVTLHPTPSSPDIEAAVFNFRILHVTFVVLAPLKEGLIFDMRRAGGPDLHLFWPSTGGFRWPPPESAWIEAEDYLQNIEQSFSVMRPAAKPVV